MNKSKKHQRKRGSWRVGLGLFVIGTAVAGTAIVTQSGGHASAQLPQLFGHSHGHSHSNDCLHSDPKAGDLKGALSLRAHQPIETCEHHADGAVTDFYIPPFLSAMTQGAPSSATLYAKSGRPILSVCFAPGTPQEVIDAHMQNMQNQAEGAWPDPFADYQTNSSWAAQGTPVTVSWSIVPDGVSIIGYNGEPTSNNVLTANLDADFAGQGGRPTWIARMTDVFNRWDQISGLTLVRRTAAGSDFDDGANFDTSSGNATRGDCRIAGHTIDGSGGVLAYNFYPGAGTGGNMVMDTGDNWGSSTNANVFFRNTLSHEHGHGLGMAHVCPVGNNKLMEPFLNTGFDGPQHDEFRHVHRLYGDAYETNDTAALATNLGSLSIPSTLNNFEVPPATLSGINPGNASMLSIDGNGDIDFYRFTVGNTCQVTATISPIGLSYGDNAQNAGCTQTSVTNSANQADLVLELVDTNGSTVLATANVTGLGGSESVSFIVPVAGTYYFRVTENGTPSQSQLYGIDVSIAAVNPVPVLTSISPTSGTAGGAAFTLTVNGSGFYAGSVVRWNGSNRTTTFVSPLQLTASITAADIATAGTATVTVFNAGPGGGTSSGQTFTINNPVPTTTSISPTSATAGVGGLTLTVNGTNFNAGSVVRWNGSNRTTTFVNSTQVTASITAADLANAGTATITVFNAAPGGGTSNGQTFTINNPVPTAISISPSSATAGGAAFTLTVNGSSFNSSSVVRWNGTSRTTTFVSSSQLTASITAADIASAGTASVTVFNPAPGGGTSSGLTFTINNPLPTTTTLSPAVATAGGAAFTLTVGGTNFNSSSVVRWNGSNRTTTFVSATQLTASITAADIAIGGTASVTVFNPAPGGGTSNSQIFLINNPMPTTTTITPSTRIAGSSTFTLTVNGTNFNASSVVRWNGSNRTTTFVSATQLTASISAADIATAGTATVTVNNPAPGGGTSNSQSLSIENPVPTTTSISPNSGTAGGSAFTITVNGTNFNSQSIVRWNGSNRTTTFVTNTQLTASINASDIATAGTATVTVFNPTPGGGTSNSQTFTINNPVPTLTSISPSTVSAGGAAFTLTCNGTNFNASSVVRINGNPRTTTFISATQLQAAILASDISSPGTATIQVFNPAPGGGLTSGQTLTIQGRVFSGVINLEGWVGSTTGIPITLKFRPVGGAPGSEVLTTVVNLTATSTYSVTTSLPSGNYDILADGSIWLQKKQGNVNATVPAVTVNFNLTVGDLDGDEEITNFDYSIWAINNGSTATPGTNGDLDGDGEVTNFDYSLWASNNGLLGDP